MRRYLIYLSYFGSRYRGFQKQNINGKVDYEDPHTICGLLEIALKGLGSLNYPTVVGSSRTDKGVHALCNTVHVDLDGNRHQINSISITKRVNIFFAYNDHDIRVWKVQQVAEDFHCRYKTIERKYLYRLAFPKPSVTYHEKTVIPYPITEFKRCYFLQDQNFDAEAVKSACSLFIGLKDFASLRSKQRSISEPNTVRELYSLELTPGRPLMPFDRLTEEYIFWDVTCRGRSFLYHQVRRIVSSLLAYGQGRVTKSDLQQLFDKPGDESWRVIGSMVSGEGLFLTDIQYKAEDLALSEDLSLQEIADQELQQEMQQILDKLNIPDTSILEKINLRKRLLEIKKMNCAS